MSNSEDLEITTRYGADLPNPATVCPGPCEGMGVYPDMDNCGLGKRHPTTDDVPFITCEVCGGMGVLEGKEDE